MSQENVEKVLGGYNAWNRRDFDAALADADPEVDWTFAAASAPPDTDATYHGPDRVREFWRIFVEPWQDFQIEVERTLATGDLVVAFVQFHAKGRDGLELDAAFVQLFTFRDGKIIRFQSFDDRAEALEAAGLSE